MLIGSLRPTIWSLLAFMLAGSPLAAQEPIRLGAARVTITPKFESEGLSNQFDPDAPLPAAMLTTGGGDTWVACMAYSPDGASLAVGDRPTRPICTFLGASPVNENGGLIRIVNLATGQVSRTIRPAKKRGHEYEILKLAYSPDGKSLVGHGKEVWPKEEGGREVGYHLTVWDPATGQEMRRIDSAKLDDWELPTFSPDASTFAARTNDGLRLWDVATGREWPRPVGAQDEPSVLAFSLDGKTLAAGDKGGGVGLWEVASGKRIGRFPAHRKNGEAFEVESLQFSPDGKALACGGLLSVELAKFHWEFFSIVRLLDPVTGLVRLTIPSEDVKGFLEATFSPDGKTLAMVKRQGVGGERSSVLTLWDAATGKERASVPCKKGGSKLVYSPDGSLLADAGQEWIVIRDASDGRERATLFQGFPMPRDKEQLVFSPDGKTFASANGSFHIWDLRLATAPPTNGGHRFDVTCLAYDPEGRRLASASLDQTVKLWDVSTRRNLATLVGHEDEIVLLAYSPDGRLVASADKSGSVRIWNATTGTCRSILQGSDSPPKLLAFSADGRTLLLVAKEFDRPADARRWDVATGALLASEPMGTKESTPAALSPDGALIAFEDDSRITIRDAFSGKLRAGFRCEDRTFGLLVSRDGEMVIQLTGESSVVRHRKIEGDWRKETLFTNEGATSSFASYINGPRMAMTPDGRRFAAEIDGSLRAFDLATGRTVAVIPNGEERVTCLALAPDGKSLATGRRDGDIVIHDLSRVSGVPRPL
jgi:WD40 repeat protein